MGAHHSGDMVDVVLDEGPDPHDGSPAPRPSTRAVLRTGARGLRRAVRRHRRLGVAGLAVLALVGATAGAARFAAGRAEQRDVSAQMASVDGAVLGSPASLRVLWTSAPEEASSAVGAGDGLWLSLSADRTALLARDADTGESRWRAVLPPGEGFSDCRAPVPAVHVVTCVTGQGDSFSLLAVSTEDGSELGRSLLPDTTLPTLGATEDADVLVVQTAPDGSGTVVRRSPLDGTVRWTAAVPAPSAPPLDRGLGQSLAGGFVAFSGALDAVLELDTGAVVDTGPVPGDDTPSAMSLSPLPEGGVALWRFGLDDSTSTGAVLDGDGRVLFPLADQPLTIHPDDHSGPAVVLATPGQSVQGLDARTGEVLWTRAATVSQAVRYDGALTLVLWDDDGTALEQLDPGDGEPAWTTRWDGVSGAQSYLVDGSLLLVGTDVPSGTDEGTVTAATGRLAQVDLHDGTLRELPWPEGLTGSVGFSVQDHRLYAVSSAEPGLLRVG